MNLINQNIFINDLWQMMRQEQGEDSSDQPIVDLSSLAHKRILITGAAGYLGRYLIQGCLDFESSPELIVALDHNALKDDSGVSLDEIMPKAPKIISITGEAGDLELLTELNNKYAFDIIIHAAANKYLPQLEQQSAKALIQNTWTTYRLIEFTKEHKIPKFIYISTDKATAPSSIYGLSKLWPERHMAYCALNHAATEFSVIRLGNLLGSTGSVLRLWEQEWDTSGNITLRSSAVKRYFILPDSAALGIWVITACHEPNMRWAIDPGKPWSIQDLAHTWLKLKGIDDAKNHIRFTELLPGEKLSEALWEKDDKPLDFHSGVLNYSAQSDTIKNRQAEASSVLKYVPLNQPSAWSQSRVDSHLTAIKTLNELCEGTLEDNRSISNTQALNWFNHQKP